MSNLHIQVNKNIIDRYKSYGLSTEYLGSVLLTLLGLYEEQYDVLDAFDDGSSNRQALLLYHYLTRKGMIERNDDAEATLYSLTEKGAEFIRFMESQADDRATVRDMVTGDHQPVREVVQSGTDEVSEWIQEWIELFPESKIEGRYLRTNKMECADRMKWFIKNYDYDRDTIFKATRFYLSTQESSPTGHVYTRNSSYFIYKGRGKFDRVSDLATWCDRVLKGEYKEQEGEYNRDVI